MPALKKSQKSVSPSTKIAEPVMYQQALSPIPRHIIQIIQRIQNAGYSAYLVGGCVRDLLINIIPKDFDIATDAKPHQLLKIFPRKSTIIGRRFPIVHVLSNASRIEVTTFRGTPPSASPYMKTSKSGQILVDNHYGTQFEDAFRRDLTINALYYDPVTKQVLDYVNGMGDIQSKTVNIIGKPGLRFREDPVRMLRCVRLGNKMGFELTKTVRNSIKRNAQLIRTTAPARLFEEFLKLTLCGQAEKNIHLMTDLNLFQSIFTPLFTALNHKSDVAKQSQKLVSIALANTDKRITANMTVTPSFLLAVLLWPQTRRHLLHIEEPTNKHQIMLSGKDVLFTQNNILRIPKRFSLRILSFWQMQYDLQWPLSTNTWNTLTKKDFRAAYDFLLIRQQSGELTGNHTGEWWQKLQDCTTDEQRQKFISALPKRKSKKVLSTLDSSFFEHM